MRSFKISLHFVFGDLNKTPEKIGLLDQKEKKFRVREKEREKGQKLWLKFAKLFNVNAYS